MTTFGLGSRELKKIIVYGFKRSFFPGDYRSKRLYVRQCMDFFERVEREAGEQASPGPG